MSALTEDAVREALTGVIDPEIRRDIVSLDMVDAISISPAGFVTVTVLLTVAGCPLKDTITRDTKAAVEKLDGVTGVEVVLGTMTAQQRRELRTNLQGAQAGRVNPFAQPGNLTKIYAVASGKGGVGKSSLTANLAVAFAAQGLKVGVIDADIYGFSIPGMLGVTGSPTKVDEMILPQVAHGVKVMSIGMFVNSDQAVVWRGPMLHRALEQFLTDVYWGDLDILLLDLPPGTGDIAISVAQLLPQSELLIVTTPQQAAAQVAQRAGSVAQQTKQRVAGVIENMSYLDLPDGTRMDIFGTGGGEQVAENLTQAMGAPVKLLAQIPLDAEVREGADAGTPAVVRSPDSAAARAVSALAGVIARQKRGLAGKSLGVTPLN